MSEFSNSWCSKISNSEDESQIFDSSESSSSDSSTGQISSSTSTELNLNSEKRPPYSFNSIIAMAIQSSPQKRMRLYEIYEYFSSNFPYYSAKNISGWKNTIRHNLSVNSHFQKVKSEDEPGNYWAMTENFGANAYIGENCGKLIRRDSLSCSEITQLEDKSLLFDSSVSSSSDSSIGQKSSSTFPELDRNPTTRPPYTISAIITMAIRSSPQKRMRLHEIYEYFTSNFPYYSARKSSGWKNTIRHNLSVNNHFQNVKSEDGEGNYWAMTENFGTDAYIGEKCGKFLRGESLLCSEITQLEDKSLLFDSSVSSSSDLSTGQKSSSTSPDYHLDPTKRPPYSTSTELNLNSEKRPPYSFHAIIAMAIQSSPQKRMRLQEIYEYISANFPYYSAKKSFGWQNSVRQNLSVYGQFQKVRAEDGQGNYWEMSCDFGTDVYKECGKLLRGKGSTKIKSILSPQPSRPPPIPVDLPNVPLMPNPFFFDPAAMMLQNQVLIQMMIQNYQLQQSLQGTTSIGTLPFSPFLLNELPKKSDNVELNF